MRFKTSAQTYEDALEFLRQYPPFLNKEKKLGYCQVQGPETIETLHLRFCLLCGGKPTVKWVYRTHFGEDSYKEVTIECPFCSDCNFIIKSSAKGSLDSCLWTLAEKAVAGWNRAMKIRHSPG